MKITLISYLFKQAARDENWYKIVSTSYDFIWTVLSTDNINNKNVDLIMKENFLGINITYIYENIIRPSSRQVIENITSESHWELNQGDIIKINPVLFQIAKEFGHRNKILHYEYFYLIKITKMKYYFAEIGSWQANPLKVDSAWLNSILDSNDQLINRVYEKKRINLLLSEVKDLLRSFEKFCSPSSKERLTSFYLSLSSYVIGFLDDETKNKVNKIIEGV